VDVINIRPDERVFRLDDECYIVYIGKDREDYKPFLRIGTTEELPEEIRSLVYSVVVADTFTGSPLVERENFSKLVGTEIRYVGDPQTVKRYKKFLRHSELPAAAFEDNGLEQMEEAGVFVYFYDDGNIRIKLDNRELLDLKKREERDVHYPKQCRIVREQWSKNPYRVTQKELAGPGFVTVTGSNYLFSGNRITALSLPDSYFMDLAGIGVDPDRVTTAITKDTNEGLLRLFKRARERSVDLRILTSNTSNVKATADLFKAEGPLKVNAEVAKLSESKATAADDFRLSPASSGGIAVQKQGLPVSLYFGSGKGPQGALAVDAQKKRWHLNTKDGRGGPIFEGVPYTLLEEEPPAAATLYQSYFPRNVADVQEMIEPKEATALRYLKDAFEQAFGDGDSSGSVKSFRNAAKSAGSDASALYAVLISNAAEIARVGAVEGEEGPGKTELQRIYDAVKSAVPATKTESYTPGVRGQFRVSKGSAFVLYRLPDTFSASKTAFAQDLRRQVATQQRPTDPEFFVREEDRLFELLAGLDLAKARTPRAARPAPEPEEKPEEEQKGTGQETEQSGEEAAREQRKARARAQRRRRRALPIAAAALVLLALLVLLLWQFTDVPQRALAAVGVGPLADGVAEAEESGDGASDGGAAEGDTAPGGAETGDAASGDAADGSTTPEYGPEELAEAAEAGVDLNNLPPGLEEREGTGGITITILDIIRMANRIATDNGYRGLGAPEEAGPDPDWIYPGNEFILPDESTRTVVRGDTIWGIAADHIEDELRAHYAIYRGLMDSLPDATAEEQQEVVQGLEALREATNSENFAALLSESIEEVRSNL
jgi:hypothetical protein